MDGGATGRVPAINTETAQPLDACKAAARGASFDADPQGSARTVLLLAVGRAARLGTPGRDADGLGRELVALEMLNRHAADDETATAAADRLDTTLAALAREPVMTTPDLTPKLAALVHELARAGQGCESLPGGNAFMLAACALADLTMLRHGPEISLPPEALAPIATPEALAFWRRVATEGLS